MSIENRIQCDLCKHLLTQSSSDEYAGIGPKFGGLAGAESEQIRIVPAHEADRHLCRSCYRGLMKLRLPEGALSE